MPAIIAGSDPLKGVYLIFKRGTIVDSLIEGHLSLQSSSDACPSENAFKQ